MTIWSRGKSPRPTWSSARYWSPARSRRTCSRAGWSGRWRAAACWSTSPSTRVAASKPRGPPRGRRRPTWRRGSPTSASPTCPARCRGPVRKRSARRSCPGSTDWPPATGAASRLWCGGSMSRPGGSCIRPCNRSTFELRSRHWVGFLRQWMTVARAIPERGKRPRATVKEAAPPDPRRQRLLRDIAMIMIAPLPPYLLVCLATHSPDDPGWFVASGGGVASELHNAGGPVGARIADILLGLTGYVAYLLPLILGAVAWIALFGMDSDGDGRVDFGPALRLVGIV